MPTLGQIIDESIKSALKQRTIDEEEKQASLAAQNQAPAPAAEEPVAQQSATVTSDSDDVKSVPDVDMVIDRLNSVRSGKSLKDPLIGKNFDEYFNSLSDAEKTALFVFLKGIAQIVTGEMGGQQAVEPGDKPVNISITKEPTEKVKHVKPNVLKTPMPVGTAKASTAGEDTSAPTAIVPKKRNT
jgi:hypothetical protein